MSAARTGAGRRTFTALAVTVAFERDLEHLSVGTAASTLAMTVLGTLLAVH